MSTMREANMTEQTIDISALGPAQPITPCGAVSRLCLNPEGNVSAGSRAYQTKASIAAEATRLLEQARARDVETHEKNIPAIDHNTQMRKLLNIVMKRAGVPEELTKVDPKSRSYPPKRRRVRAEWITEVCEAFPVEDNFARASSDYERLQKAYQAYTAEAEKEKAKLEAEQAAALARRQADIEYAMLLVRYGLGADATAYDLLRAIRAKSKIVDLAVAMEEVRGDWNEGCEPVTDALGRFTIETDQDREIAADVHAAVNSFHDCQDGRVFRDTAWNYGRLYGLVPAELAADASKALHMARRW
ncbi:hypothetical protein PQJ75_01000 [Rhodoplanes sp. TEM]|uniref:Uncharacterized protein n=1 Tax=Rhodoplanes tepidamans TaxID=200616 RepID=A0ABT5J5A3_RHOTP|nr:MULTISPECIES: hypothetical protein [Rhodoplanes]MDC7784831.1 hypothetical protein [Rhodoplanes tepidamans]MDC7982298.1 hypothetical protein [Rhodoplanes sp. TEM]MDQ0356306.1 hypothetical protein [Rhodoplanes tepidamans]